MNVSPHRITNFGTKQISKDEIMIEIQVNHETKEIPTNSNLNDLLKSLDILGDGIAIAINNEIITKSAWNNTLLDNKDNVTIIQATQGG